MAGEGLGKRQSEVLLKLFVHTACYLRIGEHSPKYGCVVVPKKPLVLLGKFARVDGVKMSPAQVCAKCLNSRHIGLSEDLPVCFNFS